MTQRTVGGLNEKLSNKVPETWGTPSDCYDYCFGGSFLTGTNHGP